MTLERYMEMLEETKSEDGWVSVKTANIQYAEEFPDAQFTLLRRENDRIRIGFSTFICPTVYLESYFSVAEARREGISYQTESDFSSITKEHYDFLAERRAA